MHRLATLALVAAFVAGCGSAREVKDPRTTQQANGCDQCHGYPPRPGFLTASRAHPTTGPLDKNGKLDCHYCHPRTVAIDNVTILTKAQFGQHLDGKVEYVRGHVEGYEAPALHGPDALAGLAKGSTSQDCTACHGANLDDSTIGFSCVSCHKAQHQGERFAAGAADFRTNCTFCHGTAKPAFDYSADLALAAPPDAILTHRTVVNGAGVNPFVGAHQAHMGTALTNLGLATPTAADRCSTCHAVPAPTIEGFFGHLDGVATVTLTGVATAGGTAAAFDPATGTCTSYCHGATMIGGTNTKPKWTDGPQACDSCHGTPPGVGANATGYHAFHVNQQGLDCAKCHMGFSSKNATVVAALHVNGKIEVVVDDGKTPGGFTGVPVYGRADHSWSHDQCEACHKQLGLPVPNE